MNSTEAPKKCILVVEDNRPMCEGIAFILQLAGYQVVSAFDAIHGIKLAARTRPDVALLDINMPAGGGFSIAEFLRHTPETAGNPIVFLTANTSPEAKLRAAELGAAEFLQKPLEIDLVLSTVGALTK